MKVSVKVPATSANIGPGFDCMGMALPIYNIVTIDETVLPGTGVEINILSEQEDVDKRHQRSRAVKNEKRNAVKRVPAHHPVGNAYAYCTKKCKQSHGYSANKQKHALPTLYYHNI